MIVDLRPALDRGPAVSSFVKILFVPHVRLSCCTCIATSDAPLEPPRKLLWVLGYRAVVRVKAATTSLGVRGACRQSTTSPSCPQHFGPFTAAQVALDQSIYRPLALSLFLSPLADDEAHAYHDGDASSTSPSASLRPKSIILSREADFITCMAQRFPG